MNLILNSVAPFLGIIEECGELAESFTGPPDTRLSNARDAVGDIFIYLADFIARSNLPTELIDWDELDALLHVECPVSTTLGNAAFLLRRLGSFTHAVLKRHQGIRGYEDREFYIQEIKTNLIHLLVAVGRLYYSARYDWSTSHRTDGGQADMSDHLSWSAVRASDMLAITEQTWALVKQRNWKANKESGT